LHNNFEKSGAFDAHFPVQYCEGAEVQKNYQLAGRSSDR